MIYNRRTFMKAAGATVGAVTLSACGINAKSKHTNQFSAKPNIVFFFIDDMGYGDIGPFGSTLNKTPNLDRMATEGIKFTSFYVSSTACTPSRSSLMTGCYADRVGMDGDVVFPADKRGLNPKEITVPRMLKSKGYATGCFGKWHLGDQPRFMPLSHGFDEYTGIPYSNDMWPPLHYHKCPPLPFIEGNKVVAHIPDGKNQALLADAVTTAAVDFIKRHKDNPFFAYIPHSLVHAPRYTLKQRRTKAEGKLFRAQVEEVDSSVGRILNTLTKLGIEKNTLVFFTSDNGGTNASSMGPFRGAKWGPKYEGHMRVPTLAWWPGTIPPASTTNQIAATIDILPTLANLTDAEVPKDRVIDGRDITDILLAKPGANSPHDVLFYEIEGVRKGRWKLVLVKEKYELYDLETDIGEKNNLAEKFPQKLNELKGLLDKHKQYLQKNRRPAAFVENPKALLTDTEGLPTLAEYMGWQEKEI